MEFKKLLEIILFVVGFLGFSYLLFEFLDLETILESVGFFAYFLIPIISIFGSNILTASFLYPILFFFYYSGMNLILLAALVAIGGTCGDLIFAFFGNEIHKNTKKKKVEKLVKFFEKNKDSGYIKIFIFLYAAFFPMSNEFMTLALGYLKYPYRKMLFPLLIGNFVFYATIIWLGGSIWGWIF